ncbi:MAG: fused MFS/spermidine synthase [bacterium]
MHTLAVALGAFLLFAIQPLAGKWVLPWYGGAPAVWAACLVFFQSAVLFGYAWAAWIAAVPVRRQVFLHGSLIVLALVVAAALPPAGPLASSHPVIGIWLTLGVCVGLPAMALAPTSPLIQAWSAASRPGRDPYRLSVASNLGSLGALVAYPVLIEPWSTRAGQSTAFFAGCVLYAILVGCCARRRAFATPVAAAAAWGGRWRWEWLVLPAVGALLLSATTTVITQEIAPVPFLWVAPLALYLLTWVLAFAARGYARPVAVVCLVISAIVTTGLSVLEGRNLLAEVVLRCGALFFGCWFCHGEFARLRPAPQGLGGFYLAGSLGGMLGSMVAVLVAPLVLPLPVEDRVALLGAVALVLATEPGADRRRRSLAALVAVAAVIVGVLTPRLSEPNVIHRERTFFGTVTVKEDDPQDPQLHRREMRHGATVHGLQMLAAGQERLPTAYYGESSGIGNLLTAFDRSARHIGVVGLGAGTLGTYARADDVWVFYELDPAVERAARGWFTYLSGCFAPVEVRIGDARLTLAGEPDQGYDVLVLDAFSSGCIPWHLLTSEAFALYRRHVVPGGVIAVHASNHWMDLRGIIAAGAATVGLKTRVIDDVPRAENTPRCIDSTWLILGTDGELLDLPVLRRRGRDAPGGQAWSDDYVDLFGVLK